MTDRRIAQEYPQVQILRALKERCADEDVEFRYLLMDQIVLTICEGQLGKSLCVNACAHGSFSARFPPRTRS